MARAVVLLFAAVLAAGGMTAAAYPAAAFIPADGSLITVDSFHYTGGSLVGYAASSSLLMCASLSCATWSSCDSLLTSNATILMAGTYNSVPVVVSLPPDGIPYPGSGSLCCCSLPPSVNPTSPSIVYYDNKY